MSQIPYGRLVILDLLVDVPELRIPRPDRACAPQAARGAGRQA